MQTCWFDLPFVLRELICKLADHLHWKDTLNDHLRKKAPVNVHHTSFTRVYWVNLKLSRTKRLQICVDRYLGRKWRTCYRVFTEPGHVNLHLSVYDYPSRVFATIRATQVFESDLGSQHTRMKWTKLKPDWVK